MTKTKNKYIIGCDVANGIDNAETTIFKIHKNGLIEIIKMENVEEFLDWLVSFDIHHYQTKENQFTNYAPKSKSHFFLSGSPERFSSKEIIDIWTNKANIDLHTRWMKAISDHSIFLQTRDLIR